MGLMCKELRSRALMRLDLPVVGEGEVGKFSQQRIYFNQILEDRMEFINDKGMCEGVQCVQDKTFQAEGEI